MIIDKLLVFDQLVGLYVVIGEVYWVWYEWDWFGWVGYVGFICCFVGLWCFEGQFVVGMQVEWFVLCGGVWLLWQVILVVFVGVVDQYWGCIGFGCVIYQILVEEWFEYVVVELQCGVVIEF